MKLNKAGEVVKSRWQWLAKHYEYISLDEFAVMPNHVHGILIINKHVNVNRRDNPRIVPTNMGLSQKVYSRRYNTLSKTINAFKTTASKRIHQLDVVEFKWQRSFYEHIIRNEKSLNKIRRYIRNNPIKWDIDKNNPDNQ
jgi:REP element-mobilizing transposase RayT